MIDKMKMDAKEYRILFLLILLMTAITGICNQINILELLIFASFQFFCVCLPGIAILILLPIRNLKKVEKVFVSYIWGYVFTMLCYVVTMFTLGRKYVKIVFILAAIISLVIILFYLKRNALEEKEIETTEKLWYLAILAVFFVSLIVFSLRWKIPYNGGSNCYPYDHFTWIYNIIQLKKENILSILMGGRYHYLSAFQQSVVSYVTGISAVKVATCYSFIESSIFLGLSSYVFVNRMIKNNKVKIITLCLILFSTGFEMKSIVYYLWHIYLVPMSYHIAQSFGVIIILLLLVQLDDEFDRNNLITIVCFLICCTGTKGATGAVIFCGISIACVYWFFIKKKKKMAFFYFFFSLIGFGLIYAYLLPGAQTFSRNAYLTYSVVEEIPEAIGVVEETKKLWLQPYFDWIVGYIKYFIYVNPWTFIPAFIFIVYQIIRKSIKMKHLLLFLLMLIGMTLGYAVKFYGNSQMYFTLTVFPFAALLAGSLWDDMFSKIVLGKKQILFSGVMCVAVILFSISFDYGGSFRECFINGLDNIYIPNNALKAYSPVYARNTVSYEEYLAYQWINENTDEDIYILSNRVYSNFDSAMVFVFTERNAYCDEDKESIKECFNGDEEMLVKYSELGIDYVIQNKYVSPAFNCPEDVGELVFDNEEVAVYKLF